MGSVPHMADPDGALEDPVFIVGGRRSGSSLLYRTMQKHPTFRPQVEHLVEAHFFEHLPDAHRWDDDMAQPLFNFMMYDADELERFLTATARVRRLRGLAAPLHRRVHNRSTPMWWWRASGGMRIAQEYFAAAHRARGARRLLEKTPANFPHIDELLAAFPGGRAIYISRHPIDTYSSHLRRAADDPSASWAALDRERFVAYWTRAVGCVERAWGTHANRFRVIRYEEFTGDPEREFRDLCSFLGEPFDPDCIAERAPDMSRHPVDPHLYGDIVPKTKDWEAWVEPTDASWIEDRLEAPMGALGYDRYT